MNTDVISLMSGRLVVLCPEAEPGSFAIIGGSLDVLRSQAIDLADGSKGKNGDFGESRRVQVR